MEKKEKIITGIAIIIAMILLIYSQRILPFTFGIESIQFVNQDGKLDFNEGDELRVRISENMCSCPEGRGCQRWRLIGSAIWIDGKKYGCEGFDITQQRGRSGADIAWISCCDEKDFTFTYWTESGGTFKRHCIPTWGYSYGEKEISEQLIAGKYKADVYLLVECPETYKDSGGYYSALEIKQYSSEIIIEPKPECSTGETKTKVCPDESEIITERCINGKWIETGKICPEPVKKCWKIEENKCIEFICPEHCLKPTCYLTNEACLEGAKPKINYLMIFAFVLLIGSIGFVIYKLVKR